MEGSIYLDAAGAAIPDKELMQKICSEMMMSNFGNPHSTGNEASDAAASRMTEARDLVRNHFHVSKDEYDVVFTSGATSSMSLVCQCFPWSDTSRILYPMNAHTSLLGLRDYAPNAYCAPSSIFQDVNNEEASNVDESPGESGVVCEYNLLLVPGECNFSGAKASLKRVAELSRLHGDTLIHIHPTKTVKQLRPEQLQNSSGSNSPWLWLLDAAKLASTSEVDLSLLPKAQRPHFVALSFYKIFGYPTGLGALLIRRDVAHLLQKR